MSENIPPIPTTFEGWRFRSRVEARWAVFFKHIGLEFFYEMNGYSLDVGCYLPDFYLPQIGFYGEVKPSVPMKNDAREKCEALVLAGLGGCLYLIGSPEFHPYFGISLDSGMITETTYSLDIHYRRKAFREGRLWCQPGELECTHGYSSVEYRKAIYASRGARFDGHDL